MLRWARIMNMLRSGIFQDPQIEEQVNMQFAERFRPAFRAFSLFFCLIYWLQVLVNMPLTKVPRGIVACQHTRR